MEATRWTSSTFSYLSVSPSCAIECCSKYLHLDRLHVDLMADGVVRWLLTRFIGCCPCFDQPPCLLNRDTQHLLCCVPGTLFRLAWLHREGAPVAIKEEEALAGRG